jgi:hypothetical protein
VTTEYRRVRPSLLLFLNVGGVVLRGSKMEFHSKLLTKSYLGQARLPLAGPRCRAARPQSRDHSVNHEPIRRPVRVRRVAAVRPGQRLPWLNLCVVLTPAPRATREAGYGAGLARSTGAASVPGLAPVWWTVEGLGYGTDLTGFCPPVSNHSLVRALTPGLGPGTKRSLSVFVLRRFASGIEPGRWRRVTGSVHDTGAQGGGTPRPREVLFRRVFSDIVAHGG